MTSPPFDLEIESPRDTVRAAIFYALSSGYGVELTTAQANAAATAALRALRQRKTSLSIQRAHKREDLRTHAS